MYFPVTPSNPEKIVASILRDLAKREASYDTYRQVLKFYLERRAGGHPIFIPHRYGLVILTGVATVILWSWQGYKVWRARQLYGIPAEVTHIWETRYQIHFMQWQWPFVTTNEIYPQFLFCLLVGGLRHPELCSFFGIWWVIGRVLYSRELYKGRFKERLNGLFFMVGHIGVILATLHFGIMNMVPWIGGVQRVTIPWLS